MKYSWVAITWTGLEVEGRLLQNDYVTIKKNPGFLKPLGITSQRSYRPWLVQPAIEVWQEVVRKINRDSDHEAIGRSSQLTLKDKDSSEFGDYNFTIRFYRPGILCVEVKLKNELSGDISTLFDYRDLRLHAAACSVVDALIGIIISKTIYEYPLNNSFSAKPAMIYKVPVEEEKFSAWKDYNKDELVGLLINNREFQKSSPDLSDKVIDRNRDLDIKYAKSAFSMVSKQGVLTAYPYDTKDLGNQLKREHMRRFRFLEYALILQVFTEKYSKIRSEDSTTAEFLLFLCVPYLGESVNLPRSVTGSNTWKLLSEEFSLDRALESIETVSRDNSAEQEKYYTNVDPDFYDNLNYREIFYKATSPHRSIIRKDFLGFNLIKLAITVLFSLAALIFSYLRFVGP